MVQTERASIDEEPIDEENDDAEDSLGEMPPSAKLVFTVLDYDGPLTQKEIVEESMLSARTVRYALERLEGTGLVDEGVYFADARQSLYRLTEPAEEFTSEKARCAD